MMNSKNARKRVVVILCKLALLLSLPILLQARTAATSATIVNNSSRQIRNVYLSHVDADDWGANLLGQSTIPAGESFNLTNIECDVQQMKLIAEDENGCFLSFVINCGDSASWTVTDTSTRNCGN